VIVIAVARFISIIGLIIIDPVTLFKLTVDVVFGYVVYPSSFTIKPNGSIKIGSDTAYKFEFNWHREDTGDRTGVRWDKDAHSFYDN